MAVDREAWLAERRTGIGGSDAAAVCGLSPYATPLQVWNDKLGRGIPQEVNPAMEWGNRLEQAIRQKYADAHGVEVLMPDTENGILRHEKYDFLICTLDGFTADGRVLEIKNTRRAERWGDAPFVQVPPHYYLQVQHNMLVTGFAVADLVVLIGGQEYREYEIPEDPDVQAMLLEFESEFWESVQKQTAPPPLTVSERISLLRPIAGKTVMVNEEAAAALAKLKETKAFISLLEAEKAELEDSLKLYMGDAEILLSQEKKPVATWKEAKTSPKFDAKRFAAVHPKAYARYLGPEPTPQRRFLLK